MQYLNTMHTRDVLARLFRFERKIARRTAINAAWHQFFVQQADDARNELIKRARKGDEVAQCHLDREQTTWEEEI